MVCVLVKVFGVCVCMTMDVHVYEVSLCVLVNLGFLLLFFNLT